MAASSEEVESGGDDRGHAGAEWTDDKGKTALLGEDDVGLGG